MKERWGFPVLVLTAVAGVFGAGLAWMTHMHHRALRYVEPGRMAEFDAGYERLSDLTVIPAGVVGVAGSVLLLLLRPRGVPLWLIITTLALQLSVFVTRIWWWGAWAEEVRDAGSVWLADGGLHAAYTRYMDTNGIRIAVITAYAVLATVMVVRAFRWRNAHASG
ncbi:hypothetical protein [Nocardia sp. IFM 10818]